MNEKKSPNRSRFIRISVTLCAFFIWWHVAGESVKLVKESLQNIHFTSFLLGILLTLLNFVVAAERWRTLLRTYGAQHNIPSLSTALRLYLVGHFFNTALPGNISGDILRGHLTRNALPSGGAYMVVIIERAFGFVGLLLLTSTIALLHPITTSKWLWILAVCGLLAALLGASIPLFGRKIGPKISGRIGTWASQLPVIRSKSGLIIVLGQSILTQILVALTAHLIIMGITDRVTVFDSLALIPLALVATYFPTIAGLGTRELAFVALLAPLGVHEAEATAASLGLLGTQLIVAMIGGILHLTETKQT